MYGESLRIGFYDSTSYAMHSADFKIGMEVWIKAMTGKYDIATEVHYYSDPVEMAKDFEKNVINMVVATPLTFVRYFDPKLLLPGVVGYSSTKEKSEKMLLLVRKERVKEPIEKLLKGSIAIPEMADNARFYLRKLALSGGLDEHLRFIHTKGQSRAIFKLFFKQVDMAVVSQATYETAYELNPQILEKIAIYKTADLYIGNLVFLRKGIDPYLRRTVLEKSSTLVDTPKGRQVLIMFGVDTIDRCLLSDLEPTRKLFREYRWIKQKKSQGSFHESAK